MMSSTKLNSTETQDLEMVDGGTPLPMSDVAFILINGPLSFLTLTVNIFFAFCILTPRKMQKVRQPLNVLMGFIIFSTIIYFLAVIVMYGLSFGHQIIVVAWTFYTTALLTMSVNMTTYAWLMFYYYIMIVPSQRALFLWVKKNIKSVIYVVLFVNTSIFTVNVLSQNLVALTGRRDNGTAAHSQQDNGAAEDSFVRAYVLCCLCLLVFVSFATAHYLHKHVRSLAASGRSLISPGLRCQIRVTVTGILQGVLCILFTVWHMLTILSYYIPYFVFSPLIKYTVFNLYISGTTANFGVGQTLFRERAVHVWKAVKKRLGSVKISKDLRPPGNQLTSLAAIESSGVTAM